MNKLFTLLPALLLSSGIANAYLFQHVDYQSPNDSIEETPTQVDDNSQEYAPSDLPTPSQEDKGVTNQNGVEPSNQNNVNEYYDDE